jgi:hypothetical protein
MPKHVDWLPMRTAPTDGEYIVLRRNNGSIGKNYRYVGPVYRFDGGWYNDGKLPQPSSEFSGWVSRKTWEEAQCA